MLSLRLSDRTRLIEASHSELSVREQCALLGVPRSSYYFLPQPAPPADLALMRELDELFLNEPTWGSRKLEAYFALQGRQESRKRLVRLRTLMGVEAIYQKPRTSLPGPQAQRFPYLLRGLCITRPDHVWCADITYVPMACGSFYLVAVMDWASRLVLAWELSNSLDSDFCLSCLRSALGRGKRPLA